MQISELRAMSVEALEKEVTSVRAELFKLKMEKAVAQLKDVSQIAKLRMRLAQTLTVITEKNKAS